MEPIVQKTDSLSSAYRKKAQEGVSQEEVQKVAAQIEKVQEEIKETYIHFIKEHTDQDVSVFY